jgi:uncharacterized OB-fold protein
MAEVRKEYLKITSGDMEQPFEWSAGRYGSRFLTELRDNKRIVGIRCPKCGIVYAIPRQVCRTCFVEMNEWVPLKDTGTIITFTVLGFGFIDPDTGTQKPVPYTCALIRPDGADTAFAHFLDETDMSKIQIGMRAKAVFEEKRTGSLLDIKHFVLLKE